MGISTVAVYSEADRDSLHVRFADEAVCIGPPPSSESYLNIPRIMAAASITGASAIHPGYGFLAENSEFARICEDTDIQFIGPSSEMIAAMGDKALAKETMKSAGVPTVPGSDGEVDTLPEAKKVVEDIGLPVIIKASAGGGGKGMRIVRDMNDLDNQFTLARNEAERAFGNGAVYIERYIESPRHIEIQILGDQHGNITHLGERECSIQRRHQKLIEESPSPVVTPELRERMGEAAIAGAKAVRYEGAGTVEFLFDSDGSFYFMEMNTRVQVEHPVTEEVVGVDIVREQIRIASGEKISRRKHQPVGHAIECRINAEDPYHDFRPSPGIITSFHQPGGYGIRVDTHTYQSYMIPPHYDSLVAKLITRGRTREEAVTRMKYALEEFVIEGVQTTIPFHVKVMEDERFKKGEFNTHFLEHFDFI